MSHFSFQLNEDYKALFKCTRIFFGQKFNGKNVEKSTLTKAIFFLIRLPYVKWSPCMLLLIRLLRRQQNALQIESHLLY